MSIDHEQPIPESDDTNRSPEKKVIRLARLLNRYAPHDGIVDLPIPGLNIARYSGTGKDCIKTFYLPSFGIVAQGANSITIGQEIYQLGNSQMVMYPVALPVSLRPTEASVTEPFLFVRMDLRTERIAELVPKIYPNGLPQVKQWHVGYVMDADLSVIDAMTRLLECLQKPGDAEFIAPLIMDEILIRLLRSSVGVHVAEMGFADSGVHQVSEAIAWLRENFSQPVKVSDLAKLTHMSISSFHDHFKAVTSMTPVQYQKALRLQEARHLMLSQRMDATTACRMVGYVSDSQFSRDYSSFYGTSPKRDVLRLRHND